MVQTEGLRCATPQHPAASLFIRLADDVLRRCEAYSHLLRRAALMPTHAVDSDERRGLSALALLQIYVLRKRGFTRGVRGLFSVSTYKAQLLLEYFSCIDANRRAVSLLV
jgi:hypothetical protein